MCLLPKNKDKQRESQKRPGATVRLSERAQAHQNRMIELGFFPSGSNYQNWLTELHADFYESGFPARIPIEGTLEERLEILRVFLETAFRRRAEAAAGIANIVDISRPA